MFGRQFNFRVNISAVLTDNNKNVRFRGVFIYDTFGNQKSLEIWNIVKDITLFWSESYLINGVWTFSLYVPLPPPVSFLGVNFKIRVNFYIPTRVYLHGNSTVSNCLYESMVGSYAYSGISWTANVSMRSMGIEGGLDLYGTIIKTDSIFYGHFTVNLKTKATNPKIRWE